VPVVDPVSADQQPQVVGQARGQPVEPEGGGQAGRGELDRQRDPVQLAAHVGHLIQVLGLDGPSDRGGPVDEQGEGIRGPGAVRRTGVTVCLQGQRLHRVPAAKSLWGYGGAVQAPDGTVVTVASSSKKDTGPANRQIDDLVLQLGVADVAASKRFYVDRGLAVAKSYGRRYVEFGPASSPVTLALTKRRTLAKVAGVSPDGTGSHRIAVGSEAGTFTDPDGFRWEATSPRAGQPRGGSSGLAAGEQRIR
jgi:hypothetical protein